MVCAAIGYWPLVAISFRYIVFFPFRCTIFGFGPIGAESSNSFSQVQCRCRRFTNAQCTDEG